MVRTATKKKTSGRTEKASPVDDLEAEIEADLEAEFDFKDKKEDKKKPAKGDMIGKTVTFINDAGDTITGKVAEQNGDDLVVEDDVAYWECTVEDLTDQKAPDAKAPAKGKKKTTKKKAPTKAPAKTKAKKAEPEEDEKEESAMREIAIADIKIPKVKARDHNPESPKWKRMCADIKKRKKIRVPLEVTSFDDPTLTDGTGRLEAARALGWETVPCVEYDAGETSDDHLWNSLLSNEMREDMHWTQLATAFTRLIKGGDYTQAKIGRAFGISQSDIARMIGALKLPETILEQAKAQVGGGSGNEKGTCYSDGVYYELASAEMPIQEWAGEIMAEGGKLTMDDMRKKKRDDKADKKASGEPVDGRGSKKGDGATAGATRASLSTNDTGDYLRVSVFSDHVEVKAHIPWKKKTFTGFDPVAEIMELFSCVFADEDVALDSFPALGKALADAKKGLA